jgi:hypothetical protein
MDDTGRAFLSWSWKDAPRTIKDDDDGALPIPCRPLTLPKMAFQNEAEFRLFAQCWRVGNSSNNGRRR